MSDMDLGDLLKRKAESATLAKLEYISLSSIHPDDRNFYRVEDVDTLADSIEEQGLQQPLMVRTDPGRVGHVIVISGHRRLAALEQLAREGKLKDREHIPVLRNDTAKTPEEQEYQLILGNKDTRVLTGYELQEQAKRLNAILLAMREQGHTFHGRTRDKVAELMEISKSKLSRLAVIDKKLAPQLRPAWQKGALSESVAYELAQAPEKYQQILLEEMTGGDELQKATRLNIGIVQTAIKKMQRVDQLTCPDGLTGDFGCANREGKLRHISHESQYDPHTVCDVCCAKCCNLGTCKYACPHLADQVAELKKSAKAARQAREDKQTAEAKESFKAVAQLWVRIGEARQRAGVLIHDLTTDAKASSWAKREQGDWTDRELMKANWDYESPWSYLVRMESIKALSDMADKLECSIDYMLGRTDVPNLGTPTQTDTGWHYKPELPEMSRPLVIYENGIGYLAAAWDGSDWVDPDDGDIIVGADPDRWMYIPQEGAAHE